MAEHDSDKPSPGAPRDAVNLWYLVVLFVVPLVASLIGMALTKRDYGAGGLAALGISSPVVSILAARHIEAHAYPKAEGPTWLRTTATCILFGIASLGFAWGACFIGLGAFG